MQADLIPGYVIKQALGEGAFAKVYLARQCSLERDVALKVMNPHMAADRDLAERFIAEARLVAKLRHRSIVAIHDVGKHGEMYYLSMDLMSGPTLARCIREQSLPSSPLIIIRQIAEALGCAHALGIVHRDVKPGNILFDTDRTAILTDFGIAKDLAIEDPRTRAGTVIGTAAYMSPEQVRGVAEIDARSDLYSLGIVLYEMLTGTRPFRGNDHFSTALMHLNDPVPPLPAEHLEFQPFIDTLLAKHPDRRPDSADALIGTIDAHLAQATRPDSPRRHRQRPSGTSRVPTLRLVGGGAAASALAFGAVIWLGAGEMPEPVGNSAVTGVNEASIGLNESGEESLDSAQQAPAGSATLDVQRLLEMAELHELVGRISEPPGANAIEAYQDILAIDPGNEPALDALARLEDGS